MHRDKFPEKVPFRLTRMLIKAMEVAGVHGTFFAICKKTMDVLRREKVRALLSTHTDTGFGKQHTTQRKFFFLIQESKSQHALHGCMLPLQHEDHCCPRKHLAPCISTHPLCYVLSPHPSPLQESVMAMLEAFVHDPLINWRLLNAVDAPTTPTPNATGGGVSPVPAQQATGGFVDTVGGEVRWPLVDGQLCFFMMASCAF